MDIRNILPTIHGTQFHLRKYWIDNGTPTALGCTIFDFFFFLKKNCFFFHIFWTLKFSVKICSLCDETSVYAKEAQYLGYGTHQQLFSYHSYNCFKFHSQAKFHEFFMTSSILSWIQSISSQDVTLNPIHSFLVFSKLNFFISIKCKHFKKITYIVGNLFEI